MLTEMIITFIVIMAINIVLTYLVVIHMRAAFKIRERTLKLKREMNPNERKQRKQG